MSTVIEHVELHPGVLIHHTFTDGKGNKAVTLRLRSGDTGLVSVLGSALQAERELDVRAART